NVLIFETGTGKELASFVVPRGRSNFSSMAFFPDGTHLVTTNSKEISVWDVATSKVVRQWEVPQENIYVVTSSLAVSPYGKVLLEGHYQEVRCWDLGSGKAIERGRAQSIYAGFFSPDSKTLLATGSKGRVQAWDAQSGRPRQVFGVEPAADEKMAKQ